ncbi:MAG: FtsW/RodA/SpoVE family cell cycle protein [Mobilitalea sp.]
MQQHDQKQEYLEQVTTQIRCKKARAAVAEEISSHIEDQQTAYIEEGREEESALTMAIEQMGSPTEVGRQLNKIHKPKTAWRILLLVIILCSMGIMAQISINQFMIANGNSCTINIGKHIEGMVIGIAFMLLMYFTDYSILGRYPKIIWMILLAAVVAYAPFGPRVNGQLFYLHAYAMLFLPAFGGIVYAYRKKGYLGILKCLLFCLMVALVEINYISQCYVYLGLVLSSLIILSIAILMNWFGTSKWKSLAVVWGWIPTIILTAIITNTYLLSSYQMTRLQNLFHVILHPDLYPEGYQMNVIRQILSGAKLFGESPNLSVESQSLGYITNLNSDYILTFVIDKFGLAAGIGIIALFTIFILALIRTSLVQKKYLGKFVGIGCTLVFAMQGGIYIISNLGFRLISQVNLPFVSYGRTSLIVNFIVLGVMLSVFRNTSIKKEEPYRQKFRVNIERIK